MPGWARSIAIGLSSLTDQFRQKTVSIWFLFFRDRLKSNFKCMARWCKIRGGDFFFFLFPFLLDKEDQFGIWNGALDGLRQRQVKIKKNNKKKMLSMYRRALSWRFPAECLHIYLRKCFWDNFSRFNCSFGLSLFFYLRFFFCSNSESLHSSYITLSLECIEITW